jgi:hypothetical protein
VLAHATLGYALPNVAENAAQSFQGALTLYPDSEDPSLAYFIPNSADLVRLDGGVPSIGFTYWGLQPSSSESSSQSGAYLSFSMKLQSDKDQARDLHSFLASGKRVAVVPFKESMLKLTRADGSSVTLTDLFKEFDFAAHAGPAEAEVGVNALLTPVGARVFKTQLESPQALKLDYCYKFDGLGPKMDAHIKVQWSQVYEDFKSHASGGGWFSKVSIDSEIEKLRKDGVIQIQIRGGTAKMEDYVQKLAQTAISKMFVTELENKSTSMSNLSGWSFSRFQFAYTRREQFTDEEYDYSNQDLVEREGCLNMKIGNLGAYKDLIIRNADAN